MAPRKDRFRKTQNRTQQLSCRAAGQSDKLKLVVVGGKLTRPAPRPGTWAAISLDRQIRGISRQARIRAARAVD